ncbi:MAG: tRNA (adenosine(37)-N6)-threonylcarbamoyltransferase complex transferase subunit TsaD [Patescibacteria group bacterium]
MIRILGIETSCDETALALVTKGGAGELSVEKNEVLSQIIIHKEYGGVVPEVAARKHLEAIFPMLEHEISNEGEGIDAICVTAGPGLPPALRIGVEVAKTLSWLWQKPLIPVSHMEGHIYANWLMEGIKPGFPCLALIVSGGHTELILMRDHGKFERLGETIDDAAGEAFDKAAHMLGLPYPGGSNIAKLAECGNPHAYDFPRALLKDPNLNFSFAGLKTSLLYFLRKHESEITNEKFRKDVAASYQEAIVEVLIKKTARAVAQYRPKSAILAGGVAANTILRQRFLKEIGEFNKLPVSIPPMAYATDNAAMIAAAGCFRFGNEANYTNPLILFANPNLDLTVDVASSFAPSVFAKATTDKLELRQDKGNVPTAI